MTKQVESRTVDFAKLALVGNFIISLGIVLVTAGGSWDITNHILNKPETFFAPPHAVLYSGVGMALLGFLALFIGCKKSKMQPHLRKGLKISGLGIGLLIAAGPADFIWHSNFGLDGLLSPPHLVLISGMILSSVGALINSAKYASCTKLTAVLITVSLIPVWLSVTGLFYSFTLPFSDTDYFDFNPHPVFAVVFASLAYPVLVSVILILASNLSGAKFGVASMVGASYVSIMILTAIIPNESLGVTIPFYLFNMIPIIIGDVMISKVKNTRAPYIAGAIFGSAFFFMYYPLITYTYNEILFQKVMWPSLTSIVYFELVPIISPILVCAGAIVGLFGPKLASKITYYMYK